MDKGSASRPPLQTVDRALSVLLSFTGRRAEWGVMELAEEFGLDKSTAQRLLATLAARGFLSTDAYTRRYRLGPALWRIASAWERQGGMAALVEPVLAELAEEASRTAVFAIADGAHVRAVAAVEGGGVPMRNHPLVGELYPAHAGATSRAYFAFLSAGQRQALMYSLPLARFNDLTIHDATLIEQAMSEAATAGWAYSDGEYDFDTRAVAAPVFVAGRPIGSVSIGEHKSERLGDIRAHKDAVLRTANAIAQLLSPRAPATVASPAPERTR